MKVLRSKFLLFLARSDESGTTGHRHGWHRQRTELPLLGQQTLLGVQCELEGNFLTGVRTHPAHDGGQGTHRDALGLVERLIVSDARDEVGMLLDISATSTSGSTPVLLAGDPAGRIGNTPGADDLLGDTVPASVDLTALAERPAVLLLLPREDESAAIGNTCIVWEILPVSK